MKITSSDLLMQIGKEPMNVILTRRRLNWFGCQCPLARKWPTFPKQLCDGSCRETTEGDAPERGDAEKKKKS